MLLHRPARFLLILGAAALLATGCASGQDTAAPGTSTDTAAPTAAAEPSAPAASADETAPASPAAEAPVEAVTITISEFEYDVPESVPAGSEVEVVNEDREAHTLTLADGGPSVVVQGGATETFTVPAAGSYRIVCDFHGSMTAELVVA